MQVQPAFQQTALTLHGKVAHAHRLLHGFLSHTGRALDRGLALLRTPAGNMESYGS